MEIPVRMPLQFTDKECTEATTMSNSLLQDLSAKAVAELRMKKNQWTSFKSKNIHETKFNAFRAPASCAWNEQEIKDVLQSSDDQMNVLFPQHRPWTTLLVDPERNAETKTHTPIMFHIYPPSNEYQHPHIDAFGGVHESVQGPFRVMGHLIMITSGYLPKLFSVQIYVMHVVFFLFFYFSHWFF